MNYFMTWVPAHFLHTRGEHACVSETLTVLIKASKPGEWELVDDQNDRIPNLLCSNKCQKLYNTIQDQLNEVM